MSLGGGGGGGQAQPSTQTVTQQADPWSGLQPHLENLYARATAWMNGDPVRSPDFVRSVPGLAYQVATGEADTADAFADRSNFPLNNEVPTPGPPGQALDFSQFWGSSGGQGSASQFAPGLRPFEPDTSRMASPWNYGSLYAPERLNPGRFPGPNRYHNLRSNPDARSGATTNSFFLDPAEYSQANPDNEDFRMKKSGAKYWLRGSLPGGSGGFGDDPFGILPNSNAGADIFGVIPPSIRKWMPPVPGSGGNWFTDSLGLF